jgi:hypothetical protein
MAVVGMALAMPEAGMVPARGLSEAAAAAAERAEGLANQITASAQQLWGAQAATAPSRVRVVAGDVEPMVASVETDRGDTYVSIHLSGALHLIDLPPPVC